jgi:hypothetical protein
MKAKVRGDRYEAMKRLEKEEKAAKKKSAKANKRQKKQLFEASNYDDDNVVHAALGDDEAAREVRRKERESELPLAERVKMAEQEAKEREVLRKTGGGGKGVVREYTYNPKKKGKKGAEEDEEGRGTGEKKRERRGVKGLKLK